MNGLRNIIYTVLVMVSLIGFAFIFGIGDEMMNAIHAKTFIYPTADAMFTSYQNVRDFFIGMTFNVAVPFLFFTMFVSSFINRQENLLVYLVQSLATMMAVPLIMLAFANLLTQLMAMPILNPVYLQSLYISNLLTILVVNLVLSFASFVFTMKGGAQASVT